MFSNSLKLSKKDYYFLVVILFFSMLLVAHYIIFTEKLGLFCSDVYVYLTNALFFSGHPITVGNDIWLSPVICLLTAFFYSIGIHSTLSIMLVNGLLAIIGNIGMYLFLRYKFDSIYALFGTICYTTFSLYLAWLGNGSLDIPSVSFTIWAVLFALIAIEKNPKYYIPFAIVLVLGSFTRYPVILIFPPILLYFIFKKHNNLTRFELRYILLAIAAAIIMACIIVIPLGSLNSWDFTSLFEGSSLVTSEKNPIFDPAYNTNPFYYVENILNFLSSYHTVFIKSNPYMEYPTLISFIFTAILVIGGFISLKDNIKTQFSKKLLLISVILAVLTVISFSVLTTIYTLTLMFITFLILGFAFKSSKFNYNIMMLSWFFFYLAFYSYLNFKVNRYFIPCLPVIAYFITYGLYKIQSRIKINKNIIPIVLIAVLIFSGFYYSDTIEKTDQFNEPKEVYKFIITEYPDWENLTIGSATVRPFNWYFDKDLEAIKSFKVNEINYSNLDIYISNNKIDGLYNFKEVKTIGRYTIYERI